MQVGDEGMTQVDLELRELETQLAGLRHNFDDAAAPILDRLSQLRFSGHSSDKQLLIPRQARRKSPGTRLPKHF